MTVWLIESGEYSSYTVHAACMSEDEAEEVCRRLNIGGNLEGSYGEFFCTEREVVAPDDVVLLSQAQVVNEWDTETKTYLNTPRLLDDQSRVGFRHDAGIEMESRVTENGPPAWVRAAALTADEARKIAQDRWYQLLAESEGVA